MRLTFRKKGLSKEVRRRIAFLLGIFFVALVAFGIIFNFKEEDEITPIAAPTLPIVRIAVGDDTYSSLHGYVNEMDQTFMRDTVIPIDQSRVLPLSIDKYDATVTSLRYEIRSLDTSRKIAETEITDYTDNGEYITAEPVLQTLVEVGTEYLFTLVAECDGRDVYYYTRILIPDEAHEKECYDFAMYFHNLAITGRYSELVTYLEPDGEGDPDSLGYVNIHSTPAQIGWGGFDGIELDTPVVEYKDISAGYNVIELTFQMAHDTDAGYKAYYNVNEYFKVRYSEDRMYLLDYERRMEEILQPNHVEINANLMRAGIVTGEDSIGANETGTILCFEQAGALYEYNLPNSKLTKIFDFREGDLVDARTNYDAHSIRLLNVDETGALDFVVYGYMNAGPHEGECGIELYHYDSTINVAKEQVFVSSTKSYQILSAGFSELLYRSKAGDFYLMVEGTLLHIDLMTIQKNEMMQDLASSQYAISESGRYFAWVDDDVVGDTIHVMDLELETSYDIEADAGEVLRVFYFMEENLVYGRVRVADIAKDISERTIYPAYAINIVSAEDSSHEILKEYKKSGYYVTDVTKEAYMLYLDRVTKSVEGGVSYTESSFDTIVDSSGERYSAVSVETKPDDIMGSVTYYALDVSVNDDSVRFAKRDEAGLVMESDNVTVKLGSGASTKYFVYVGSRVVLADSDLTNAIARADEEMGIVVDNRQEYIWKRGKAAYRTALKNLTVGTHDEESRTDAKAISTILAREGENIEVNVLLERGDSAYKILSGALKDRHILDLTGCSVQEVLYYVYLGNPVYAKTGDGSACLIVGYDAYNVILYNPATGELEKKGLNDSAEYFGQYGNIFISYI